MSGVNDISMAEIEMLRVEQCSKDYDDSDRITQVAALHDEQNALTRDLNNSNAADLVAKSEETSDKLRGELKALVKTACDNGMSYDIYKILRHVHHNAYSREAKIPLSDVGHVIAWSMDNVKVLPGNLCSLTKKDVNDYDGRGFVAVQTFVWSNYCERTGRSLEAGQKDRKNGLLKSIFSKEETSELSIKDFDNIVRKEFEAQGRGPKGMAERVIESRLSENRAERRSDLTAVGVFFAIIAAVPVMMLSSCIQSDGEKLAPDTLRLEKVATSFDQPVTIFPARKYLTVPLPSSVTIEPVAQSAPVPPQADVYHLPKGAKVIMEGGTVDMKGGTVNVLPSYNTAHTQACFTGKVVAVADPEVVGLESLGSKPELTYHARTVFKGTPKPKAAYMIRYDEKGTAQARTMDVVIDQQGRPVPESCPVR